MTKKLDVSISKAIVSTYYLMQDFIQLSKIGDSMLHRSGELQKAETLWLPAFNGSFVMQTLISSHKQRALSTKISIYGGDKRDQLQMSQGFLPCKAASSSRFIPPYVCLTYRSTFVEIEHIPVLAICYKQRDRLGNPEYHYKNVPCSR